MGLLESLTLALGASWGSGINLYATVLVLGVLDLFGVVDLPPGLNVLGSVWVIGLALILYIVEFVADKIPGVDSLWDMIHSFIRIPAGAMMAAGAVGGGLGEGFGDIEVIAALLAGGVVAAGSHATKAGSRAAINLSPEPVTNWAASFTEDIAVFTGVSLAIFKPIIFLIGFGLFLLLAIWLLPKVWRGLKRLFGGAKHPVETVRATRAGSVKLPRPEELPPPPANTG